MTTIAAYFCCLVQLLLRACGQRFVDLPRRSAQELSFTEFDDEFLDNSPVVLEGVSLCPADITFQELADSCTGRSVYSVEGGSAWAGLSDVHAEDVSIGEFVRDMDGAGSRPPRYLFDVNVFDQCPGIMTTVRYPAHLAGAFLGHWERGGQCHLPLYKLYLAERGFRTNMHVDAGHAAFVVSMCEGSKRWRVVTGEDHAANVKTLGHSRAVRGVKHRGRMILADLPRPFDTWSEASKLMSSNLTLYEGVLEPGQTLVIPKGALHAAETLDNSLMVAINDLTFAGADDILEACKMAKGCPKSGLGDTSSAKVEYILRQRKMAVANRKAGKGGATKRKEIPFLEAYGCGSEPWKDGPYCQRLQERSKALRLGVEYDCTDKNVRVEL